MPPTKPSPQTWTLRFKNHRTTILLHVGPLQTLSTVKSELLKAVHQTHPDGKLNGLTIPHNSDDILLARPADINDLSAGWETLEPTSAKLLDGEESGKGKGRAGASSAAARKKGNNVGKDCPQGAGLRDGGIVAFKFRTEDEEWGRVEGEGDEMVVAEDEAEREEWDVVVPTLEETYGEGLPVVGQDGEDG